MLQVLPSPDPHQAWLTHPDAGGSCLRIRLYWHTSPLQPNLIQDLLRAAAARLLPVVDHWTLAPDRPWLTAARRLAGAGLLPIPPQYEPAAHFAEYRRLLPAHSFQIEVGLNETRNSSSFAAVERALLWLSEILHSEVLFFVPAETISMAPPLACHAPEPEIIAPPPPGKPHPLSDSEQKLAKYIAKDAVLSARFAFNQSVPLGPLSRHCVDLLWAEGRLVVEIDDQSHWRKEKYAADRQRDFELMRAGFQVLRITADEVLHDTEKAIEKIRILCEPKKATT